jgi:hypothetical protein
MTISFTKIPAAPPPRELPPLIGHDPRRLCWTPTSQTINAESQVLGSAANPYATPVLASVATLLAVLAIGDAESTPVAVVVVGIGLLTATLPRRIALGLIAALALGAFLTAIDPDTLGPGPADSGHEDPEPAVVPVTRARAPTPSPFPTYVGRQTAT